MTITKSGLYLFPMFVAIGVFSAAIQTSIAEADKLTIGWIENVRIFPESFVVAAKIDTGADNSSLNVSEVSEFFQGEKRWVRFAVNTAEGGKLYLEKPVVRYAKIKRKGANPQRRPVVLIDICLGKIYKKDVPVNLTDRSKFKFNMLIGRSFLKDIAVVDSSMTFTIEPNCHSQ